MRAENDADACRSFAAAEWHDSDRLLSWAQRCERLCASSAVLPLSRTLVTETEKHVMRQRVVKAYQFKPWRRIGSVAHAPVRRRSVDPWRGRLTQNLQRNRPKVLIHEMILEEPSIQRWPAFTQQRPDAMFLPEQLRRGGKIDPRAPTHADDLDCSLSSKPLEL
jgi:hypothetical protein